MLKRPLLPDARKTAESLGSFEGVVRWFGHHVLGVASALPKEYPGGGDTPFQWVRALFLLVIAAVGAAIWSALDRKRLRHPLALDFPRTFLRYGLAFTMLLYGIQKVFPIQFAPLTLFRLLEPYGDSSPMGLLWTFMGFSRLYAIFAGSVEVVGAVLLLWRRTTVLGSLLLAGATTNVLLLNLSYDVPVKLYSAHLLVMALFLAAPDGVRLLRVALLRRAEPLPPLREPLPGRESSKFARGSRRPSSSGARSPPCISRCGRARRTRCRPRRLSSGYGSSSRENQRRRTELHGITSSSTNGAKSASSASTTSAPGTTSPRTHHDRASL